MNKAFLLPIKIPGETLLTDLGIRLNCDIIDRSSININYNNPKEEFFDYEKTGDILFCRFYEEGDRFIPLGLDGSKKNR